MRQGMVMNKLDQLKKLTVIVADTGDIKDIKKYQPQDATTNPSLILKAAQLPEYDHLIVQAIKRAKKLNEVKAQQISNVCDMLAVSIGREILNVIPGRISTEVDARLSYDMKGIIDKARNIIKMYNDVGISKDRILIKLASTWQGIRAAEQLEKEGINCNLTLLFSFAQARACAEANVYLISPFVGRIMDWYKEKESKDFMACDDPGVLSVSQIYSYYKSHHYNTVVMGASFRNVDQILELAGCDRLTISPDLLQKLSDSKGKVEIKLQINEEYQTRPDKMTEAEFLWLHHQDPMATDKLAEGIRNFAIDQCKLEVMIEARL